MGIRDLNLRPGAVAIALIAAMACIASPAVARPGDVILAKPGSILRVDPRDSRTIAVTDEAPAYPADLTFGPEGELYVTDAFVGTVSRIDLATGVNEQIAYGGRNFIRPMGIAYSAERRLYVADPANGFRPPNVFRINPATESKAQLGLGSLLDRPNGVTIAGDGDIVISDLGPTGEANGHLVRLHSGPRGDTAGRFARRVRLRQPRGLATAADGSIIVADSRGPSTDGAVVSVSPSGKSSRVLFRSIRLAEPVDVGIAPSGAVYVLDAGDADQQARLLRVTPNGRASTILSGRHAQGASGIAVEPPRCDGRVATVAGSVGRDRLVGTRFADVIAGLGGNDRVTGFNGNDLICGGAGDDRLNGGKGSDRLNGDAGDDRLNGSAGEDRLNPGSGRDHCKGRGGRDHTPSCELG